jgi:glycosyltransferase involved in cell wall biosynthesis
VPLNDHSILFAPAHYITGYDVGGSELQWTFDLVSQAAQRFGMVDVVLCDLRNGSFPPNVRVHAVDVGRQVNYLQASEGARFIPRYTRAALRVCRTSPPSILHHMFPWGPRTFNPLILGRGTPFGAPRTTRVVMGPLQRPISISTPQEEGTRFGVPAAPSASSGQSKGMNFGPLEIPLRALCRATLQRADAIVALDAAAKEYIEALDVDVPISVIPAGVRFDAFSCSAREAESGRLRIACVSYLIKRKNLDLLLRAAASLRKGGCDVSVVVAGDGPERAALGELATGLGIEDAVRWLGHIANADVHAVYANADVFCTMSSAESLPAAVIEAMASGLPVISTPTTGALTLIQNGIQGTLVPFGDINALADAIGRYALDAELRARQGAVARERAHTEYSWTSVGARYAALYESLLG